jgi:hypothetical protein
MTHLAAGPWPMDRQDWVKVQESSVCPVSEARFEP